MTKLQQRYHQLIWIGLPSIAVMCVIALAAWLTTRDPIQHVIETQSDGRRLLHTSNSRGQITTDITFDGNSGYLLDGGEIVCGDRLDEIKANQGKMLLMSQAAFLKGVNDADEKSTD